MNIQRKNSAHHFRMQSEREQTLAQHLCLLLWSHSMVWREITVCLLVLVVVVDKSSLSLQMTCVYIHPKELQEFTPNSNITGLIDYQPTLNL